MTNSIIRVLMYRDNLTREEATEIWEEMVEAVKVYGEDPEDVLYNEGLEPDYVFDLLPLR